MVAPDKKFDFERFGAFRNEKQAAEVTDAHFASINDRLAFNPDGKSAGGWHGDVAGKAYQKYLKSQKDYFTKGWEERDRYRASFDVAYDYSKGLFGKPKDV